MPKAEAENQSVGEQTPSNTVNLHISFIFDLLENYISPTNPEKPRKFFKYLTWENFKRKKTRLFH